MTKNQKQFFDSFQKLCVKHGVYAMGHWDRPSYIYFKDTKTRNTKLCDHTNVSSTYFDFGVYSDDAGANPSVHVSEKKHENFYFPALPKKKKSDES